MMSDILSLLVVDFPYFVLHYQNNYNFVSLLHCRYGHKRGNNFLGRKWERNNNGMHQKVLWFVCFLRPKFILNCGKKHKIYLLDDFSVDNPVVVNTTCTLLYNRSLELSHVSKVKFYLPTPHFFLHPSSGNYPSSFCLQQLGHSRYFVEVESYSICPLVSGLFHLA